MNNAYQNKSEEILLSPEDAAKKHAALLEDIAFLEGKIEEYKLAASELPPLDGKKESLIAEIADLTKDISDLTVKRAALIRENSIIPEGVTTEIEGKNRELNRIKAALIDINIEIEDKNSKKVAIERVLPAMQQEYDKLKDELEAIKIQKGRDIADLDAKIVIKTKELKDLEISLNGSGAKHGRILASIEDMKKETIALGREKKTSQADLDSIKTELSELSGKIKKQEDEHIAKCKSRDAELDIREADIETREGNLSDGEAIYEKKKKALIDFKAGLEEFHGKKINIVI